MKTIGKSEALALLKRAVDEKGEDYVYVTPSGERAGNGASCLYFHDEQPGCIVGHALHYVGIKREDLIFEDKYGLNDLNVETGINEPHLVGLLRDCNVEFTDEAHAILTRAQSEQDSGTPWGPVLGQIEWENEQSE